MERGEPALVPEWLRSTGSVSGGGSSAHHFTSSSHLDVSSSAYHTRNRDSKSIGDSDSPRSAFLDRTSSSNSRRSSSNGSAKHAYSSFSRGHRDKDRERDKDRLSFGDHWERDCSDAFGSMLTSRSEKDTLQRSHSMVSRKQSDMFPRRGTMDLKNGSSSNHANGNGLISSGGIGSSIQKVTFEKDFPSLGSEEKQVVPDIVRVSSPGLSTATQSLPVGSSALIGGEGWTSALAEVPTIIGSSSLGSSSSVQTIAASVSGSPSGMAGLNMAEALTQAPVRTRTAPQLSVQTQRLEELAIKQSRQLIPVTPSMPKTSVIGGSDKLKPKTVMRSGEMNLVAKSVQQQQQQQPPSSLHPANQSLLVGHAKSDAPKTSKLLVLNKSGWENGVSPSPRDVASPTNSASRAANSQFTTPSSVPSAPPKSPNKPKLSSGERKSASSNLISGFSVEKRPSLSQTQSRNDFFNLLKKKTSTNTSAALSDSTSGLSPNSEKACEVNKEAPSVSPNLQAVRNGSDNGGTSNEIQISEEEEVSFLRSLGWNENGVEDSLTDEEIKAFYEELMERRPSKLCQGVQQKLLESHSAILGGASSESSSSDSGSDS